MKTIKGTPLKKIEKRNKWKTRSETSRKWFQKPDSNFKRPVYKGVGAVRCSGPHHCRMTALIHKVIQSPTKFRHFTSLLSELLQEFHHRALKRLQSFSLGTSPNGAASSLAGACWMPPHPRSCPKPTPEKQGEHITEPRSDCGTY